MSSSNLISMILSIVWSDSIIVVVSNQRSTIFEQPFADPQEADLDEWALSEFQIESISQPQEPWCPCVKIHWPQELARDVSTIGYSDIKLEYFMEVSGFATCYLDYSIVDDFPNGPWTTLKTHDVADFYVHMNIDFPADAANVDSLGIKFYTYHYLNHNYCLIKDVKLTGIQEPLPQQNAPATPADPIATESESQPASNQAEAETDKAEESVSPANPTANVSQSESGSQTEEAEEESTIEKLINMPWWKLVLFFNAMVLVLILLLCGCRYVVVQMMRSISRIESQSNQCIACGHTASQCRCRQPSKCGFDSSKRSECRSRCETRSHSKSRLPDDMEASDPQMDCCESSYGSFEMGRSVPDISTDDLQDNHWIRKVRRYRKGGDDKDDDQ